MSDVAAAVGDRGCQVRQCPVCPSADSGLLRRRSSESPSAGAPPAPGCKVGRGASCDLMAHLGHLHRCFSTPHPTGEPGRRGDWAGEGPSPGGTGQGWAPPPTGKPL